MLGATLYIIRCSARNRMRQRLRRLREPRYLLGAVAGLAYLVFTLFIRERAFLARGSGRSAAPAATASALALTSPALGGLALACASLAAWVMPFGSGLLDFSKAEIAFLYPSPMTRPQLVVYRLLRSQLAVFTAALIVTLAYPTGSLAGRLRNLLGIWLLLTTSRVFFAGLVLARARLGTSIGAAMRFGWPAVAIPLGAVLAVLVPVLAWTRDRPLDTVRGLFNLAGAVSREGAASWLLWPFTLLVCPLFEVTLTGFVQSFAGAVLVSGVTMAWLIWADGLSSDSADASAERQVTRPAQRARAYVARPMAWQLGGPGRPEMAFLWKGALQTFRTVDGRVIGRLVLILAWMVGASLFMSRARGLLTVTGVFATWGAFFAVFMAPQVLRMDLRQDLAHLELLKGWPLTGAAVLRGEIAWPAAVVTAIAWTFGVIAMTLSMASTSGILAPNRFAAWVSFLLLCPGVVLAQYTVHNGVALLFPGWVPLGASRPRGVDAVGQRLILLIANWVGLLLALLPGLVLMVVLSRTLRPVVGPLILPAGAIITTLLIVGEVMFATAYLGRVFEGLDITSVERPE